MRAVRLRLARRPAAGARYIGAMLQNWENVQSMPDLVDMRVMGLLCSHLLHAVASPFQAVQSGIEMLEDDGDDIRDVTMPLIEDGARRLAHRVRFYRSAYGQAGESELGDLAQARQLTDDHLFENRLSLQWPDAERNPVLKPGHGRMLMNLAAAAADTLPRGGVLTVQVDDSGSGVRLSLLARGERAGIKEDTHAIYAGNVAIEDLTPYNIHSYF